MNYALHYDRLIDRAKKRNLIEGYTEKHHILPKCMGGTNDINNLVILTAREHFVAHQLLVKIYPNVGGLIASVRYLTASGKNKILNNKMYEWLRKRHAAQMSLYNTGRKMTVEQIKKAADSHRGKKRSVQTKQKISESAKGRKFSNETIQKLKNAKLFEKQKRIILGLDHPNKGRTHSAEWKKQNSLRLKGKKQSLEHVSKRIAKRKATLLAKKNSQV